MGQQHTVGTHRTTISTETSHGMPTTRITYCNTTVVAFSPKRVILNSGGWYTNTTKTRMNQASNQFGLGYRVFQKDFDWFIELASGRTVPFKDNISIGR